jgi:hypothetical protein
MPERIGKNAANDPAHESAWKGLKVLRIYSQMDFGLSGGVGG